MNNIYNIRKTKRTYTAHQQRSGTYHIYSHAHFYVNKNPPEFRLSKSKTTFLHCFLFKIQNVFLQHPPNRINTLQMRILFVYVELPPTGESVSKSFGQCLYCNRHHLFFDCTVTFTLFSLSFFPNVYVCVCVYKCVCEYCESQQIHRTLFQAIKSVVWYLYMAHTFYRLYPTMTHTHTHPHPHIQMYVPHRAYIWIF